MSRHHRENYSASAVCHGNGEDPSGYGNDESGNVDYSDAPMCRPRKKRHSHYHDCGLDCWQEEQENEGDHS